MEVVDPRPRASIDRIARTRYSRSVVDAGDRLGSYQILARLRAGGMATLYLGRRSGVAGFARPVAIKVIHPHLARDREFVRMFVDEALLSARIAHPYVVHVEELGQADGTYFLVMEYVHGCSLQQLVRGLAKCDRRLAPDIAVAIAMQIAEGLQAAHETRGDDGASLGVVHRDVSPQNVLIATNGHVKVIDFGIAKAAGRAQTATGSLRGKIGYMPPEQAYGKPVDRRADVYALGIVLWELLAMRPMFRADNDFAMLELVRHPKLVPPSHWVDGIPPLLDAAVMAALATEPDGRPATALEFRRTLAEAVPGATRRGASDVADLLAAVMQDELDRVRAQLPDGVGEPIATRASELDDVLATTTIAAHVSAAEWDEPLESTQLLSEAAVTAPTPRQTERPGRGMRSSARSAVNVLAMVLVGALLGALGLRTLDRSRPASVSQTAAVSATSHASAVREVAPVAARAAEPITPANTAPPGPAPASSAAAATSERAAPSTSHPRTRTRSGRRVRPVRTQPFPWVGHAPM